MTSNGASARVASIHVYPMKACRAVDVDQAQVEPWGLAGDRRWLLVEPRPVHQPARGAGAGPGHRPLRPAAAARSRCPPPGTRPCACPRRPRPAAPRCCASPIWGEPVLAAAAGAQADAWFSGYLGHPVRLVYLDDPTRRPVDPDYGAAGDVVSFADGYPLLLTNASSLDALGDWLVESGDEPVPMTRFRPSVVVAGASPWAEDGWRRVRIGPVSFRVAKPCGRCVVTTIDQDTAERGREPLMMLGRRRRFGQELVFGQNLIPDTPGRITVGDPVEILEYAGRPG